MKGKIAPLAVAAITPILLICGPSVVKAKPVAQEKIAPKAKIQTPTNCVNCGSGGEGIWIT